MGCWKYSWQVRYYGTGGWVKNYYTTAKDKEDALRQLRQTGEKVIEVICCRRTDTW